MKTIYVVSVLVLSVACKQETSKKHIVEVSCGQCNFNLSSQKGCDLAIRLNQKSYFVDGAHIDDFGDAHNENTGFCNVIRQAEVTGDTLNGRFKVQSLKLLDE